MKRLLFVAIATLLTAFQVLVSIRSFAQQPSLSVIQIVNLPDTVYENQSYDSISITVRNYNNNAFFQDTIYVFIKQDTSSAVNTGTLIFAPGASIPGGSVVTLTTANFFFTSAVFLTGGNTVVIWPYAKSATTYDSLRTDIVFVPFSGLSEAENNDIELILAPNPASGYFQLQTNKPVKQVRIYDTKGRLVYNNPFTSPFIQIDELKPGVYLTEIRFKNGKRLIRKLYKQE